MCARLSLLLSLILPTCLAGQAPSSSQPGAEPETVILQIRVVRGEGIAHTTSTRASSPLTVEVTDETGRPVAGAAVSFRLPSSGPGGLFPNGLSSDVVVTGADGRATVSGMRWNRIPGPFHIRVTAGKGSARAGILVPQHLHEKQASPTKSPDPYPEFSGPRRKWITVTAIVAGAAAGSVVAGLALSRKSSPAASGGAANGLSVGSPVITIAGPQ
jgi:hypothetical protein